MIRIKNFKLKSLLLTRIFLLSVLSVSACTNSQKLFGSSLDAQSSLNAQSSNIDCFGSNNIGLDANRIQINLVLPSGATQVTLFMNGAVALVTSTLATQTIIVPGLDPGVEYHFSCQASIQGVATNGKRALDIYTLSNTAPNFAGVSSVQLSGRTATVNWPAPGIGAFAYQYLVYAIPGDPATLGRKYTVTDFSNINWSNVTPDAIVPSGSFTTTISNLGDEIPYTFIVRACAISTGPDLCSDGSARITQSISDLGAPLALTASPSASIQSVIQGNTSTSTFVVSAPWAPWMGAINSRTVYVQSGATVNNAPTQTPAVGSLISANGWIYAGSAPRGSLAVAPSDQITLTTTPVSNQLFRFVLVDVDPSGNARVTMVPDYTVGNITPPVTPSTVLLTNNAGTTAGSASENSLTISWTGVAETAANVPANGASSFTVNLVAGTSSSGCTSASPTKTFSVTPAQTTSTINSGITTFTYDLTGLSARTQYYACIQAQDSSGNVSPFSVVSDISGPSAKTLDYTPPASPAITALQYSMSQSKPQVLFYAPADADLSYYYVDIKQYSGGVTTSYNSGLCENIQVFTNSGALSLNGGTGITTLTVPGSCPVSLISPQMSVTLRACDNAHSGSPSYNSTADNCSSSNAVTANFTNMVPPTAPDLITRTATAGWDNANNRPNLNMTWAITTTNASVISNIQSFNFYKLNNDNTTYSLVGNSGSLTPTHSGSVYTYTYTLVNDGTINTNLGARQSYKILVKSVNSNSVESALSSPFQSTEYFSGPGCVTNNNTPSVVTGSVCTLEHVAPVANANPAILSVGTDGTISWPAFTSAQVSGSITYTLYQSSTGIFGSSADPTVESYNTTDTTTLATLAKGTFSCTGTCTSFPGLTSTSKNISVGAVQGTNYGFALCADDSTGNVTCIRSTAVYSPAATPTLVWSAPSSAMEGYPGTTWSGTSASQPSTSIPMGTYSRAMTYTLTNTGGIDATGCSAATISNTTDFEVYNNQCAAATLAAGSSCTISIRAKPVSGIGGKYTQINETCTGVSISTINSAIGVSSTSGIDFASYFQNQTDSTFGLVRVGAKSTAFTAAIRNQSAYAATCTAPSFTGINASEFEIAATDHCILNEDGSLSLQPYDYCFIKLRANPATSGAKAAGLTTACTANLVTTSASISFTATAYNATPIRVMGRGYSHYVFMSDGSVQYFGQNSAPLSGRGLYTNMETPATVNRAYSTTANGGTIDNNGGVLDASNFAAASNTALAASNTTLGARTLFTNGNTAIDDTQIALGANSNCVVRSDGQVQCWGLVAPIFNSGSATWAPQVAPSPDSTAADASHNEWVWNGQTNVSSLGDQPIPFFRTDGSGTPYWLNTNYQYQYANVASIVKIPDIKNGGVTPTALTSVTQIAVMNGMIAAYNGTGGAGNVENYCALRSINGGTNNRVDCWGGAQLFTTAMTGNGKTYSFYGRYGFDVPGAGSAWKIFGGADHMCLVLTDQVTMYCWGENTSGELGLGTSNGYAVATDGTAYNGSANPYRPSSYTGPIGTGAFNGPALVPSFVPTSTVAYKITNVVMGVNETFVLLTSTDGNSTTKLFDWGYNGSGNLARGTVGTNMTTPGEVTVLANLIEDIRASKDSNNACAILKDGTLKCWGDNTYGLVGNGTLASLITTKPIITPTQVVIDPPNGNHTTAKTSTPLSNVADVAIDSNGAFALTNNTGTGSISLRSWGFSTANIAYSAATENNYVSMLPRPINFGAGKMVVKIASDENGDFCAILNDGTVSCAGTGTNVNASDAGSSLMVPTVVGAGTLPSFSGANANIVAVASGFCATNGGPSDTVYCWGSNNWWDFGIPNSGNLTAKQSFVNSASNNYLEGVQFGAGSDTQGGAYCVLGSDNLLYCSGRNASYMISPAGSNTFTYPNSGSGVLFADLVSQFSLGNSFGMALLQSGSVKVWGAGAYAGLGVNNPNTTAPWVTGNIYASPITQYPDSTNINGTNSAVYLKDAQGNQITGVSKVSARVNSGCFMKNDSAASVWCWGGSAQEVGEVNTTPYYATQVTTLPNKSITPTQYVTDINSGAGVTCALLHELDGSGNPIGRVECWGISVAGIDRPGNGSGSVYSPTHALLGSANIQKLWSAGGYYYFVIDSTGQVWTWGLSTPYGMEGQSVLVNPYNEVSGYGQGAFYDPDSESMVP